MQGMKTNRLNDTRNKLNWEEKMKKDTSDEPS